jgi:hypothetical protein
VNDHADNKDVNNNVDNNNVNKNADNNNVNNNIDNNNINLNLINKNSLIFNEPLALFFFGSMERGNKVFRVKSFESKQIKQMLIENKKFYNNIDIPMVGFYSFAAFANLKNNNIKNNNGGGDDSYTALMFFFFFFFLFSTFNCYY